MVCTGGRRVLVGDCHRPASTWSPPYLPRGHPKVLLCHSLPDAWGDSHHQKNQLGLTWFIQKTIITYKHRLREAIVQVGAGLQDN